MSLKEDVLEQVVDDWLKSQGYFTQHNVKFKPARDSNHSDIDAIGFNPKKSGVDKVLVVSCKSWQNGFNVEQLIDAIKENKIISGREAWKFFREVVKPQWSKAFIEKIEELTGCNKFTYVTAVTCVKGNPNLWQSEKLFLENLENNPIRLLSLPEMIKDLMPSNTTLASSQLGRLLQLIKAAGCKLEISTKQ